MPLTAADLHHWAPIPAVVDWLTNRLPPEARVLEIGPGHAPFWRANVFVDFVEPIGFYGVGAPQHDKIGKWVKCDIATDPLPFEDKSFDFIYCRHTLEDMWNPFHICKEMERVGKAGYIETPSPIAELCRGVDGGAPPYRGYHHHRWVVWINQFGQLTFISKYPIIEYLDIDENEMAPLLRKTAYFWNTYFMWEDRINLMHLQSPLDYDIPRDYRTIMMGATVQSRNATIEFGSNIPDDPDLRKSA